MNTLFFIAAVFLASTAALLAQGPIELGTSADFAILTKTGISTVPTSAITGDIGVSPIAGAAMTGFSFVSDSSGSFQTSTQFTGRAYAANFLGATEAKMTAAIGDMGIAYTAAAAAVTDAANTDLYSGLLAGKTLTAGVYKFGSNILMSGDLTLTGSDTDIFIIQTTGSVTMAANKRVVLAGSVLAQNVFWQVAMTVTVGTGAHFEGIILAKTAVTFMKGSSLNGRILSQTACVLDSATITP